MGKIILFTFLALLAIIVLLLVLPMSVRYTLRSGAQRLRLVFFGFVPVTILPSRPRKQKPEGGARKKKTQVASAKREKKPKKDKKSLTAGELWALVREILPRLARLTGRVLGGIAVRECTVTLLIHNDDFEQLSAKTGRLYAYIYGGYTMAAQAIKFRHFQPTVVPNYIDDTTDTYVSVHLRIVPVYMLHHALAFALGSLWCFIRGRGEGRKTTAETTAKNLG